MTLADWQGELGGLTFGAGTLYELTGPVGGLGTPAPRTSDVDRGAHPGEVSGLDVLPRRVLTVPFGVNATTATQAMGLVQALKEAWAESALVDVAFSLQLPGMTARRWYGRPRGIDLELDSLSEGWVEALGTFEALDPYAYGDPVVVPLTTTSTVVTNPGDAPTDRFTIEITGAGGTPVLTNSGADASIRWAAALTGTRNIDLRARTVATTGGADKYSELSPSNEWWDLQAGGNTITRSDISAASITLEPAYR